MKNSSYCLDIRTVNFAAFDKDVWKCPKKTPPNPNSSKEVLLIKEKHGGDVECVSAWWVPRCGYTNGDFFKKTGRNDFKIELDKIYLWRDLAFIESGDFVK